MNNTSRINSSLVHFCLEYFQSISNYSFNRFFKSKPFTKVNYMPVRKTCCVIENDCRRDHFLHNGVWRLFIKLFEKMLVNI